MPALSVGMGELLGESGDGKGKSGGGGVGYGGWER